MEIEVKQQIGADSRISQQLDEMVRYFRERELAGTYPYIWLDALYLKVRQNHHIVSQAVVIAIGVKETASARFSALTLARVKNMPFG